MKKWFTASFPFSLVLRFFFGSYPANASENAKQEPFDLDKTLNLITTNASTIDTLSLRYKGLSAEQQRQIFKALQENTSVTSLHMSGNEMDLSSVESLSEYVFSASDIRFVLSFASID